MANFASFTIRRISPSDWRYVLELTDSAGNALQVEASIEDLDVMTVELDRELDIMVEAAAAKAALEA